MIVGFLLVSAAFGILSMGVTIALALPVWITLITYPLVSGLSLLLCATLCGIRAEHTGERDGLQRQASHG